MAAERDTRLPEEQLSVLDDASIRRKIERAINVVSKFVVKKEKNENQNSELSAEEVEKEEQEEEEEIDRKKNHRKYRQCTKAVKQLLELSQAPANELDLFLSGETFSLANPLNDLCSVAEKTVIIRSLLDIVDDDGVEMFAPQLRVDAIDVIRNLSRVETNRFLMFRIDTVIPVLRRTLVKHTTTSTGGIAKELALVTLNNLALDDLTSSAMLVLPGFVSLLAQLSVDGETEGIRKWSLGNLRNIAVSPQNATAMCQPPLNVDDILISCVRESNASSAIKETALWALVNMSCGGNNRFRLLRKPLLLESLVDAIAQPDIQKYALRCLLSLSYLQANHIPLYEHQGLVSNLTNCIEKSFHIPSTPVAGSTRKNHEALHMEDAFRILAELSSDPVIMPKMRENLRLITVLLDLFNKSIDGKTVSVSDEGGNLTFKYLFKIKFWTINLAKEMGVSTAHFAYFNVATALASIQVVHRLGRKSLIKTLNKEIIREIIKCLVPPSVPILAVDDFIVENVLDEQEEH